MSKPFAFYEKEFKVGNKTSSVNGFAQEKGRQTKAKQRTSSPFWGEKTKRVEPKVQHRLEKRQLNTTLERSFLWKRTNKEKKRLTAIIVSGLLSTEKQNRADIVNSNNKNTKKLWVRSTFYSDGEQGEHAKFLTELAAIYDSIQERDSTATIEAPGLGVLSILNPTATEIAEDWWCRLSISLRFSRRSSWSCDDLSLFSSFESPFLCRWRSPGRQQHADPPRLHPAAAHQALWAVFVVQEPAAWLPGASFPSGRHVLAVAAAVPVRCVAEDALSQGEEACCTVEHLWGHPASINSIFNLGFDWTKFLWDWLQLPWI